MPQAALAFVGEAIGGEIIGGALGSVIGGALGGGLGAEISGGDFWQGALSGGIGGAISGYGLDKSLASGLNGLGIGAGAAGMASNALLGGAQSVIGGGNFLSGAAMGAFKPMVSNYLSGGQQESPVWTGQAQTGLDVQGSQMSDWVSGPDASQQAMLDAQISGMELPDSWTGAAMTQTASTGGTKNILQGAMGKLASKDTLIPSLVSAGSNLYMQNKADKLAEKMAGKVDAYSGRYNALLDDPSAVYQDPAYKQMSDQVSKAVMRQAAATGNLDNPGIYKIMQDNQAILANNFLNQKLQNIAVGGQMAANGIGAANPFYTNNYLYAALQSPLQMQTRTGKFL
jgi:hypothetical protein